MVSQETETFKVSIFNRLTDTIPQSYSLTIPELRSALCDYREYRISKDGKLISFARFNGTRCNNNFVDTQAVTLDFDKGCLQVENVLSIFKNLIMFWYSTHRHCWTCTLSGKEDSTYNPQYPRFKVVIPLSRPVKVEEFELIVLAIKDGVPSAIMACVDTSCFEHARAHYLPSCLPEHTQYAFSGFQDGKLIDADLLIDRGRELSTNTPYGLTALDAEVEILRNTPPGPDGGRNNQLNKSSMFLGQLVAGGELQHDHVVKTLLAVASEIGRSKGALATIRSGMKKGLLEPRKPSPVSNHLKTTGTLAEIKNMAELLVTKFAAIRWVIYGLLPEGLAILSGPPKIGKSWFVMNICLGKSIGGFVLGKFKVDAGVVLLLSLEDNERRLQGRLKKCLNGESHDLSKFNAVTTWRRLDQGGIEDLTAWLEQNPDCSLVVIDTIQKIKPNASKNANAYENDYQIYGNLQRLALKFCCCILVIHHNRKSDSKNNDDPLEQISGSTGITGSMDTILMLRRPRGATGAVLSATGRDIPEAQYAMKFDGDMGQWIIDGKAAELSLGDGSLDILDVFKAHAGHSMTVAEVNSLLPSKEDEASLKTRLYRLAKRGILSAYKGKFLYIDTVTGVTGEF